MYRHKNTLDIDLYVQNEPILFEDSIKLSVKYWNRHSNIFQPNNTSTEVVIINKDQFYLWREL